MGDNKKYKKKNAAATAANNNNNNKAVAAKKLSTKEPDDIDAGIELDCSSNSGSSVKDISEDQSKSASVSPVMAQNNLVNDNRNTKHAAEMALCADVTPSKKVGTTKQQLAANLQVIDADEQQLQNKLQNKQRKSSVQDSGPANNANNVTTTNNGNLNSPQSPALCKICDQHVYQMERMLAEKSVYHKGCFRCHQCKIQLRIDNYSSHEGQVYCKAHHRQLFQPQVKLDSEDDVDIVAKSRSRKRQMIICENQPAELPKDVIRSDTKVDDGIDQLNLNLNNILEKFERGTAINGSDSQPSSAVVIEKPSFNIKQTLMAFEKSINSIDDEDAPKKVERTERPLVRRLTNLNGFLERQSSTESDSANNAAAPIKPLAVRRSESLMMRLKKYESRIAGEQVADDDSDQDDEVNNNNNNNNKISSKQDRKQSDSIDGRRTTATQGNIVPKKLTSIDLSSLKSQWENGDISKRRQNEDDNGDSNGNPTSDSNNCNGNSPSAEKNEELCKIRQQLARKKLGESGSVKNIYENAIKEAQLQKQQQASKRDSSDLSALNGFSTTEIQQQLLQNGSSNNQNSKAPTTPNKDHFQLNLSNKANKLKEKFELGLITNSSRDDSDQSDGDDEPPMTKLEQIRQEKLEDLSIFTEGEIKAREARSMFQQIDRRLSAASGIKPAPNPRSLASISASMRTKLTNQMNANGAVTDSPQSSNRNKNNNNNSSNKNNKNNHLQNDHQQKQEQHQHQQQQPIRLTNNVRT